MNRVRLAGLAAALLLSPASQARAGSVTGRLIDDAGKPVASAKVIWLAYGSEEENLVHATRGADPPTLGETSTDAEGRFKVALDKPGMLVSLRITAPGLPSTLIAGPHDAAEDASLEEIQLSATEKLSGRVVDEAGKPVGGARVRAAAGPFSQEGPEFFAETTTGTDGNFTLAVPEDRRFLSVRAPGYTPVERFRADRRASPEKVTLKRGGVIKGVVRDKDGQPAAGAIVLAGDLAAQADASGAYRIEGVPPGSRTIEAFWKEDFAARQDVVRVQKGAEVEVPLQLSRAAAIAGAVVEEKTRKPVPGALVRASVGTLGVRLGGRADATSRRARTDARGRFRIAGLSARRYSVQASRDGFLQAWISGVAAAVQTPGSASLALIRAATVSGRVTTEDGKAVPGARVRLVRDDGPMAILNMRAPMESLLRDLTVRTRPDGSFRLRNLSAGKNLTLEAALAGHVPAFRHGVTIKSGDSLRNVVLVLRKGLEARGRVADSQGQPIPGAEIRVTVPESPGMAATRIVSAIMRSEKPDAVSASDGGFLVSGLEEGEFQVTVRREGYAPKTFSSIPVQAKGPNEWQPFVLAAAVSVTGFVRDADGAPIVAARVSSFAEGGVMREDTTGSDGSFRLEGFATERTAMVMAQAEGFVFLQRQVTPPASDLVLVLKKGANLRGRVEDAATKRALTDFSVGYFPQRAGGFAIRFGGSNERGFHSADGSFEMTDVTPGKWALRASAPGYRSADVSIDVSEGETREGLVISLKQGGALAGRVLDPRRGVGVPNATVIWQAPRPDAPNRVMAAVASRISGSESSTATDADGLFRFEGLPEGRISLTASHPDFLEATKELDADAETNVDLTLGIGGSIAGTVLGKDGRTPVGGAEVNLNELGSTGAGWGGGEAGRTDAAGNFLFEHLKAGRFHLTARAVAGKTAGKEVILGDGQRLDGVLLTIAAGTTVRGTVSGLPANQLGQVRVVASAKDYTDSALTDDGGRFTFRDVPGGSLRISASTAMMSGRTVAKSFEVPEGAGEFPVEIPFEGSSRLAGQVTKAGRPLSGLFINASPDPPSPTGGRGTAQTDENGAYEIEGLSDGNYQVFVSGSGISYRKTFTVSGETAGDIELPAVSITGFVTDAASGEPIEGASLRAETGRETATFAMRQAVTDSRGFFSLDDLDAGSYKVTARRDGYQPKEQTVTVGSSSSEISLALQRGGGLPIRAMDGVTGLPLNGVIASVFSASGGVAFSGSVSLDSDGKGEISSLAPGSYTVHLFSGGYAPRSIRPVAVPGAPVSVAMTPGGRVELRTDGPVNGRIVEASGATYMVNPWRIDGRVNPAPPLTVWENFAPGSYQLLVSTPTGEKSYPFTVAEGRTTTLEIR